MTATSNKKCETCIFFRDGVCKADKDRYLITNNGREKLMWECDEKQSNADKYIDYPM